MKEKVISQNDTRRINQQRKLDKQNIETNTGRPEVNAFKSQCCTFCTTLKTSGKDNNIVKGCMEATLPSMRTEQIVAWWCGTIGRSSKRAGINKNHTIRHLATITAIIMST